LRSFCRASSMKRGMRGWRNRSIMSLLFFLRCFTCSFFCFFRIFFDSNRLDLVVTELSRWLEVSTH
jgi:hypothetical protein